MAMFEKEGPEGTGRLFCHVPAGSKNYPEGLRDNSHLQFAGAVRVAQLFLDMDAGMKVETARAPEARPADIQDLVSREDSVYAP